jgi:TonB family protein
MMSDIRLSAVLIILLISPFSACAANSDSAAQQLLVAAELQSSLFHGQVSPFELDIDFIAQVNVPTRGQMTLKWAAADRWWRKIVLGTFEQIDVRNGEKLHITRNIAFTPIPVRELIDLVEFAEGPEQLVVKKPKQRAENGVQMVCLLVEPKAMKGKSHEVCIDSLTHDLLSDQWEESTDERPRAEYSDYFDFGAHRYPRHLELRENGSKRVDAKVRSLTTVPFDESLLVPPQGAVERRECVDMKPAIPIKTQDPLYPWSANENRLAGNTTVVMTVETDGSVAGIHLIGSSLRSMDDVALHTLRTWKFKPAMCGMDPIVSDVQVVVKFRTR